MKSKKIFLITIGTLLLAVTIAHETNIEKEADSISNSNGTMPATATENLKPKTIDTRHAVNYYKINLTAPLLKNHFLQYEGILGRKISIAIGYRTMPNTSVPSKYSIKKAIGEDDQETQDQIENIRMSNTGITPEVRIYVSKKGYGRGFFLGPFYRYGKYSVKGLIIIYDDDFRNENTLTMSGKLTGNSFGQLLGVQWQLGKHIGLNWWMLGPHYGNIKGDLTGFAAKPLIAEEQADIRQTLEDIYFPFTNSRVTVNTHGVNLNLDVPFAGFRWGLYWG